ncbi:carbohydrate ABC transporter substrate-binding protein, CUT1 family [Deinococcus geothermalis DSM 11300]|uniref:Carbohydrate ABC transporter substrate-binding protein, CUT1 family n=1 Tax=Deinococcus geothermalis (strain DSM 11300 / CIP 105573 / AG-3a) TaxID=319795 RepID=Q1J0D1_DEIGD|nr:ABC transporter substrate-binding protein [Deinococcus geothermalis]ABF45053.1 carbohydrate ABC transporter substrate-binding protein, CUT1 family [Deinococcus geothermalis DSM 11300]
MKNLALLSLAVLASGLLSSAGAQTTIRINGYGGTDPAVVGDLINRFVKPAVAKDNITVVYQPLQGDYNQQLTTLLASGTAGDVFYVPAETLDGYVKTGKLLPLGGLVSTTPYIKTLNTAFTRNGRQYAIPKDFNTLILVYNKDLFDEAGVPYPTNNETWTSLQQKLTTLKQKLGPDYYGLCLQPNWDRFGAFAFATGWPQFGPNGKTNLADPRFVEAFNWYIGLAKNKVGVTPSELSQDWTGGCLKTGKVAVAIEGSWIVNFLRDNAPNLKFGSALLPKNPKTGQRGNFLYTVGWGVNANTKNRAAALKVLNALTSPQAQQYVLEQGLAIPSRSALTNSPYFKKNDPGAQVSRLVFEGADDGYVRAFTFGPQGQDWTKPINEALAAVLSGQRTAADALKKAQQDMATFQNR